MLHSLWQSSGVATGPLSMTVDRHKCIQATIAQNCTAHGAGFGGCVGLGLCASSCVPRILVHGDGSKWHCNLSVSLLQVLSVGILSAQEDLVLLQAGCCDHKRMDCEQHDCD